MAVTEADANERQPYAYRDRVPRHPMEASEVVRLVSLLEDGGVTVWLDGGWDVDALTGEQLREHDDLDLVVELAVVPALTTMLLEAGYRVVAGAPPASVVLADPLGRQVDVHPVSFDQSGGVYRMEDGREWVYPAQGFLGAGRVAGRAVRCLTPEVQVLVHDGYELTEKDYRELRLLHERFGAALPEKVRERALATGDERG
jgi:lincosamide nucleotidyltransferase A/C/D/E